MKTVLICGGGIAGLSAAQELAKKGFSVTVLEAKDYLGGKARSLDVPGTSVDGRPALPGEHGFRFFPGFYSHLSEMMREIPTENGKSVFDHLVPTTEMLMARVGLSDLNLPSEPPNTFREMTAFFGALTGDLGIPPSESMYFGQKMFEFLSSGYSRRDEEYDDFAWWDFIEASSMSDGYQKFLGEGATRSLVAMKAEMSSTKTIATVYFQMIAHLMNPVSDVDRLLDGPTQEVWIDPWERWLESQGVAFKRGHLIERFDVVGDRIGGVDVKTNNRTERFTADYYIAALPVEVMERLLTPELEAHVPQLSRIRHLKTEWMNGIQFYLDSDIPLVRGHGLFLDSPWALTSISQAQFWEKPMSRYGDGTVRGILSIVISDWERPGVLFGRPARLCSRDEIRQEVWAQLENHLHDDEKRELNDANVVHWFLDDSITFPNPHEAVNLEPLLVNTVGSWRNRPDADLGAPNFFVASDYVKTFTDLATMEGATEAARRAVNGILERERRLRKIPLYRYREWSVLEPLRRRDEREFRRGRRNVVSTLLSFF